MVAQFVDLLTSLPKSNRDIESRASEKTPAVVAIAKQFGFDYFDGDRKYGYGGYYYDGRWVSVVRDIVKHFCLKDNSCVLDVGCGKGFLVTDLLNEGVDACGLDVSPYAILATPFDIREALTCGTAERLPYLDRSFDLVVSINTLHNLPREGIIRALKEIQRVSRGSAYVVVDAYHNEEEKELFLRWCLTAETHGYPEFWLSLFQEAGYEGAYSWNVL